MKYVFEPITQIYKINLCYKIIGVGAFVWTSTRTDIEVDEEGYVAIEDRGYENPEALISASELNEIKDQDDVVVLDFRRNDQYLLGHIPGAVQLWRPDVTNENHEYAGICRRCAGCN